jgi:hypothetical protein
MLEGTGDGKSRAHLKCININESAHLTQLRKFCFSNFGLQSVDILVFVQVIDWYCFSYCCDLCTLFFAMNSQLTDTKSSAFTHWGNDSVCIPKFVQVLKAQAFSHCPLLHDLTFEDRSELCQLGKSSFTGTLLSQVCIPGRVKNIGDLCFAFCPELTSLRFEWACRLAAKVALGVGRQCFSYCGLESICIPKEVRLLREKRSIHVCRLMLSHLKPVRCWVCLRNLLSHILH